MPRHDLCGSRSHLEARTAPTFDSCLIEVPLEGVSPSASILRQHQSLPMLKDLYPAIEAVIGTQPRQPGGGFMDRLIGEAECPPVNGHHVARLQIIKRLQGILWVTVDLAE